MKQIKLKYNEKNLISRGDIYNAFLNKYYNLFMNSLKWKGIDNEQTDFIMRKFWSVGGVASFIAKGTQGEEYPQGMIVFTEFAPVRYNIYDFPIEVTLINNRGVPFIPMTPQLINTEVVIGYAQRNKKGIRELVHYYINKLTNIEITIQINLIAQKSPWIIGTTPENQNKMEEFWSNLISDNPKLFTSIEDVEKAKALVSGAQYTIDKLYNYKVAVENELREYLGLTNLGVSEKKEHLITEEVKSNNEVTSRSSECILNPLQEFCERVKMYLGYNLSVELNAPEVDETVDNSRNDLEEEDTYE